MIGHLGQKILISVIVFSLLASIGIYHTSNTARISEEQAEETSSLSISSVGSSNKLYDQNEQQMTGFRKFAKMFAKEENTSDHTDNSLLGPKGRYDEVYIGSKMSDYE